MHARALAMTMAATPATPTSYVESSSAIAVIDIGVFHFGFNKLIVW